ncbi:MAG TPA: hypothetical protein VGI78_23090 [Acetobacteraceae bacterium]
MLPTRRVDRQGATPLPPDSEPMLGLSAYVGLQSRRLPMAVAVDGPARCAGRTVRRYSLDLVELELYLGARANGLVVETPAVRP